MHRRDVAVVGGGIHVLAAQNGLGEVVIGDSHEYGTEFDPVERAEIEELILDYLRTMIDLPDATIASCGGGTGMTMSFGLAEDGLGEIGHGSTRDASITGQEG